MNAVACTHEHIQCLNEYEFVRKYRCLACDAVMMCACDEERASRFLPHQLDEGVELETQRRIPVTHGFLSDICPECRGLPAVIAPVAEIYGRTSKIKRYYWREIFFDTEARSAAFLALNPDANEAAERERIENEVVADWRSRHAASPKYVFQELSQDQVIKRFSVDVVKLTARYVENPSKGRVIDDGQGGCSVEAFVASHYAANEWNHLEIESRPWHVLFGVFTWLLIQDATDPDVRMVGFGSRTAFDEKRTGEEIWTLLPEDFGGPGYARRREDAIEHHFEIIIAERDELLWQFDYWLPHSEQLREYLWAHDAEDIDKARRLVELLPPEVILRVVRYLLDDYWRHYCGWPDLLFFTDKGDWFLAEAKSSNDKLSEDQKRWIRDNSEQLHLPFKLVKVHRLT